MRTFNMMVVGVLCTAFIMFGDCAINVNVTPPVINIGHTESLQVTCSVQKGDFPDSLFSITLSHSPAEDEPKFTYLASINNRDGHVRKISSESKTAIGVINNSGDSYLTLTWTRPTFKRSGVYKCDVIAMDVEGKPVTISNLASVGASNDDMDAFGEMFDNFTDLYNYSIRTLKYMCENKTQEINAIRSDTLKLEKSIYHLDETINDKYLTLKSEFNVSVSNLQISLNTTEQNFSKQISQINSLYKELNSSVKLNEDRLLNISLQSNQATMFKMESGSFTCGMFEKNFPIKLMLNGNKAEDTTVTFTSAFPSPPTIILAPVYWDLGSDNNQRLTLQRLNVTTTGFVARCGTWSTAVVYKVTVEWFAISTPPPSD